MAVIAANTGHLVLSTIHTSRASSCISRMVELGVNEDNLYENLICVSNQRMMVNKNDYRKIVLYEIMDEEEIEFFRRYKHNSKNFISIKMQKIAGVNNGLFAEDTV